jgi:hypothetical protein
MDRNMCTSAATYIQRFYRFKWRKPSPYASFFKPAPSMQMAADEFTTAKQNYDVWLKVQCFNSFILLIVYFELKFVCRAKSI